MKASKTLHAPAKLNLTLEVLGRRADGMHGLRSVMVPVDLCDDIEIAPAGDFSFSCDRADLRENNIVESAMRALNVSHGGTSVTLKKRIPTGAGMGGGSSDAAAILLAGAHGMFGTLRGLDMVALAGSLGSDVPFFLAQTAALVEGTGERVTPLGTVPRWHAVIVKPPASISTAWAYEQIDKSERAKRPRSLFGESPDVHRVAKGRFRRGQCAAAKRFSRYHRGCRAANSTGAGIALASRRIACAAYRIRFVRLRPRANDGRTRNDRATSLPAYRFRAVRLCILQRSSVAQRGIIGMTAVVLAGGPADALSAKTPGAPNKAFVSVGGVALVERTLRALRGAASISRIIVVAPQRVHGHPALALADECRPDGARIRESLASGLEGLPLHDEVLVSTSDFPVLTAASIDDYVMRAHESDADVTYGCVEKRVHVSAYPQVPHTWAHLSEGSFCGTGFVTIRPRVWPSLERFIERLGRARKNPFSLARIFGFRTSVRYVTRRLTIAHAEGRASYVIGARVRAVVSPYPEIAVNVDRVSDIALAEQTG